MKNKIKDYRKDLGLTLEQLADMAGTTKSYIWELENNSGPSIGLLKAYAISKALCQSVYEVFPDNQKYEEEIVTIKKVRKTA